MRHAVIHTILLCMLCLSLVENHKHCYSAFIKIMKYHIDLMLMTKHKSTKCKLFMLCVIILL